MQHSKPPTTESRVLSIHAPMSLEMTDTQLVQCVYEFPRHIYSFRWIVWMTRREQDEILSENPGWRIIETKADPVMNFAELTNQSHQPSSSIRSPPNNHLSQKLN
jgi:hypothetical protein